tara:strand:- start:600 stop:2183 length:1584 start_codon:yes stop_codon:yes gene_type:complete
VVDIYADVIIVGGGPTGLTTANYLGMQGVKTILVERNSGTVQEPRAVSIDDETMRGLQTIGLVEKLIPNTLPGYGARYYSPNQKEFARIKPTTREFGHPRRSAFHQPELEALLYEGLKRFPSVEVMYETTFESFEQDSGGVTVKVRDKGKTEKLLRGVYLAACDGGRSSIRHSIGAGLIGSSFEERWLVFDTVNDLDCTPDSVAYCDHRRPAITLPGPGNTRRWEFLVKKNEDAEKFLEEEKINDLLRPYIGDKSVEIVRKVIYTFHARIADKWREGRIFLIGDAAHLTPPYAGQGMNSGQRDAANFSWKAAAVIQKRLTDKIMETYESERRYHAWSLIQMAIQIGWAMVPRNWFHTYGQITFFRIAGLIPKLRDYFLGMKFKPIPRFQEGFLLPDGRSPKNTLVGRMIPQPTVKTIDGVEQKLDDVMGPGFVLLAIGGNAANTLRGLRAEIWQKLAATPVAISLDDNQSKIVDLNPVILDPEEISPRFLEYDGWTLLVRPDRYVAAAFTRVTVAKVETALQNWMTN